MNHFNKEEQDLWKHNSSLDKYGTEQVYKKISDRSINSQLNVIQNVKKNIMENIYDQRRSDKSYKFDLDYTTHVVLLKKVFNAILKKAQIEHKTYFPIYLCYEQEIFNSETSHKLFDNYSIEVLIKLAEKLHDDFLHSKLILDDGKINKYESKQNMSYNGTVYTPVNLAKYIIQKTIDRHTYKKKNIDRVSFLDFGCGTGTFYFEALKIIHQMTKHDLKYIVLNNLYGIDYDPIALSILMIKICTMLKNYTLKLIKKISKRIVWKNMLHVCENYIPDVDSMDISYKHEFPNIFKNNGGFDIIVSNPPYRVLKGTGMHRYQSTKEYIKQKKNIKEEVNYFRNNNFYNLSTVGMLNYYRLSLECMLKITDSNSTIGLICPATIFGDISTCKLRKEIFGNVDLHYVAFFPEKYKQFEHITQATTIMIMNKNAKTSTIHVDDFQHNKTTYVNIKLLKQIFKNYELPFITSIEWKIIKKISKTNKIRDVPAIRNKRGEFDLFVFKKYIIKHNTKYPLIRGRNILRNLKITKSQEFVDIIPFLSHKSTDYKSNDYQRARIIGQQITNVDSAKRLRFTICKKNHIIANSCNYLTIGPTLNIKWILIQLNSHLLNWRFKMTSTNNHVNNYEIDQLPILCDHQILKNNMTNIEKEVLVCVAFCLNMKETIWILKDYYKKLEIISTYRKIKT